jgi:hypothetical protein
VQAEALAAVADAARDAVRLSLSAIASHERLTFSASVASVAFKGPKGVTVTLGVGTGRDAHALADVAGKSVTIVIEDVSRLLALDAEATAGEPDNRPLFDASTEPPIPGPAAKPRRRGRRGG